MADQLAGVVETGIGAAVVGGVLFGAVLGGRSCGALPSTLLDRPVALWQAVVAGGVLAYMGARASTMMGSEDDLWEDLDDDADESEDESGSEDEGDSDDGMSGATDGTRVPSPLHLFHSNYTHADVPSVSLVCAML